MKVSFLLIALFSTVAAVAQQPEFKSLNPKKIELFSNPLYKKQPNKIPADTTLDQLKKLRDAYRSNAALIPLATYSHTTSRGKIYTLPIDNMPCLVPDMKQVTPMPGNYRNFPGGKMPNLIPERPLIPKEQKEKDNK